MATEKYFVGSPADAYGLPRSKVELSLPYRDVFNPEIYRELSDFKLPNYSEYNEVITIPYVTEAKDSLFEESKDYVMKNMDNNRLFVFKYRKKSGWLDEKKNFYQEFFKDNHSVLFFDSPLLILHLSY